MVGKTERITKTSGVAPALSGLVTGIAVAGAGSLRQLQIGKVEHSGIIRVAVYCDSGLVIDNMQVALQSGVALPSVDLAVCSVAVSGATMTSGLSTQMLNFTEGCQVMYTCTSGSVNIMGVFDVHRRLIQS